MGDELWFIEFGRGAALPLTPEETSTDGEPTLPCAQGRVVYETTKVVSPELINSSKFYATLIDKELKVAECPVEKKVLWNKPVLEGCTNTNNESITRNKVMLLGRATRPGNLDITPWYHEDFFIANSSSECTVQRNSDSSNSHGTKELTSVLSSEKFSIIETKTPRIESVGVTPRKAYMDLVDAIALLDETCPNQEFNPSATITTEASLMPYKEFKKMKSKSKQKNFHNYSHDRLNQRSFKRHRPQDKTRPLLRKIGMSKTEDIPFMIKLTPNLGTISKPCLQKNRSRKSLEPPTTNKISSLTKFIFDMTHDVKENSISFKHISEETDIKTKTEEINNQEEKKNIAERFKEPTTIELPIRKYSDVGQSSSVTIHSFETDDLDTAFWRKAPHRGSLRASLDDIINTGSCLSLVENLTDSSKFSTQQRCNSLDILWKHKIATNQRSVSSSIYVGSFKELDKWGSFSKEYEVRASKTLSTTYSEIVDCTFRGLKTAESTPNLNITTDIYYDRATSLKYATHDKNLSKQKSLKEEISNSQRTNTLPCAIQEKGQQITNLNKQEQTSHLEDQKTDRSNTTSKCRKWQILLEPLQETVDMFNELRKVSSLLNIPSWEKLSKVDKAFVQLPKQIFPNKNQVVKRENSKQYITSERSDLSTKNQNETQEQFSKSSKSVPYKKTYLSFDHVLHEKQQTDSKAITLTSAKDLISQTEVDSKCYLSDIFNVPLQKKNKQEHNVDMKVEQAIKTKQNHRLERKVAKPIFQKESSSQKMVQIQGRTNDFYEIVSSKTVPYCAGKQLSKVSAEEDTKLENFTLGSKVDYQSVIEQKRTKCFPL